jgi:23S rRNA pseudouridine1911/1915/1917 synthase
VATDDPGTDLVVPAALDGERLDRVVAMATGRSRNEVAERILGGEVRVAGEVVTSRSRRVVEGEVVTVDFPPVAVAPDLVADPAVVFTVVHEDPHLIVVDKPAGLVVHPGAGHESGTLVNGLLARFPDLAGVGDPERPGVVHRLDRGTSGLLVVARTDEARHALVDALSRHDVDRVYRALVWGHLDTPRGLVDAPIGRSTRQRTLMAVVVDGRPARTSYEVLATYRAPVEVSELRCQLETGRTHQIRVHLASIDHPVVGDDRYGPTRPALPFHRPWLHAERLAFDHPVTGEHLEFTSDLPADLLELRARLSP